MHHAWKYPSHNTQENEAQNTGMFPPLNVYVPSISTGLEDKPLLPSVFRPSSTFYTAPLSRPAQPYLSNAISYSGSNNTTAIPTIQTPYLDNTIGYVGSNNATIPAIQKPYLDNTTGYAGLNNASVPAIRKLDPVFSMNNSFFPHEVSAQNWVPLAGSNASNLVKLSPSSLGSYSQKPLQSYESVPPYYHYTMPNTLPAFDERSNRDHFTIQDDGNPFKTDANPELPIQGTLSPVDEIDQNYSSVVDNKDNFISDPNDALEQTDCSSDNRRPFFGNINTCSDLRLSSHAPLPSFTEENSVLINRDFGLSSYSAGENNDFYVSDTSGDERSYEKRKRYSYLETREARYSPKENRDYHNTPNYNRVEKDRSRRSYPSSSVDRLTYSNKRQSPRARSRSRSPVQSHRYSSTRTRGRSKSPKQKYGDSHGKDGLRDERRRLSPELRRTSHHSPQKPDKSRSSSSRRSETLGSDSSAKRKRSNSSSSKSINKSENTSKNLDRKFSSPKRSNVKDDKDKGSPRRSNVKDSKDKGSPRRSNVKDDKDKGSPRRSNVRDNKDKGSPRRSNVRDDKDKGSPRRSNVRDDKDKGSPRRSNVRDGKDKGSPRRSNVRDGRDRGTSRALKCFCLPEPYIERKFVYEQSTRYYQSSLSSQKSTSMATDNVGKLQKEFEDMLSKSLTFQDCPLTTSAVVDPINDPEEDSQYVSELLDKAGDVDTDVSSESDVDLEGFDVVDEYDSDDDSSEDEAPATLAENRFKNQDHPRKLHHEMWFNVEGELNHGKECLCSLQDKKKWIVHNVYPNEKLPQPCEAMGNNGLQLYHYWVTVFPHTNFMTENPTTIQCNGRTYTFEGFSLLSHSPLDAVPRCFLTRFNFKYEIFFIQEPIPTNFCIKDLNLFSKFLFHDILELYDWNIGRKEEIDETCDLFHFLPRFTYKIGVSDDGCEKYELLSMRKVFEHLLKSHKPLITEQVKTGNYGSWKDFVGSCVNSVVTRPGWKPSSIRIDDVERDQDKEQPDPLLVHHGIRPVQLSFSGDPECQKLMKKYLKMRTLITNKPGASQKERLQLIKMKLTLDNMRMKDSLRRDCCVHVSSVGMMRTGLNSDITQHALLLPVLVHHVRYHLSLQTFDEKIGYVFKDRSLLQLALTHPSYVMNYGTNPDHARNTLSNCGVKQPRYGDRRNRLSHTKKKGIVQLIDIMAKLEDLDGSQSFIQHNERLEFLGDAILEFICTCHLYFLFPEMAEGGLVTHRSSLVQNKHLAEIAKKLDLDNFMQFSHGPDLCHQEDMEHAMANCLEAILGAIYLDSDVNTVQRVFCKLAFEEIELRKLWSSLSPHPLQIQQPEGDRQFISSSEVLKGLVKLEEAVGLQFSHIRLLARAFTHPQVGFNNLTLGNNQRMELLGDALVQWVVTDYLYRHFPEHHEGHLTLLRSSLVNRTIQAQIASEIGLDQHVHFGVGPGVPKLRQKHLSDLFEAFLAALFVDKGIEPVEVFCKVCLFPRLRDVIVNQEWMDAKSQLQSCCLTQAKPSDNVPVYKVLKNVGSPNMKLYTVGVYFKGKRLGTGFGDSIREAEMNAAQTALATNYLPEYARQKRVLKRKHDK